ncbi:MAG: TlpA disulfide reductase family protein [Candidatus Acidiferrales bacterium]
MRKLLIVLLTGIVGLVGIAIGIAGARSSRHSAPWSRTHSPGGAVKGTEANSESPQANGKGIIRFANNPQPMPPFLVNDLDGKVVSTAEWHGKVVLLNFWATWCPPCRMEIPELIALTERYKDRLQVVGISLDDAPPGEVKAFAKEMGINYPVVIGGREILAEYGGVPALPTTFVANPDGRIVQKHVGFISLPVYDNEIRSMLGMQVDATVVTFEDTGQIFLKNAARATELPGVDLTGLSPEQRRAALKRLNSEGCNCGCRLTLAQCRINDTSCPISQKIAAQVVDEIRAGQKPSSPPPAQNQ